MGNPCLPTTTAILFAAMQAPISPPPSGALRLDPHCEPWTMPKFDRAPSYVRLLNMLNAIRNMSPFSALSGEEERLLDELVVRWHSVGAITISDVMESGIAPSQTTTYRRLIALRDKGLINLRVDEGDKRVKYVEPSSAAEEYMARLGNSLNRLMQGEQTG